MVSLFAMVALLNVVSVIQGMCEMVMVRDDMPKDLLNSGTVHAYPGTEDSDEEDLDALADSYDIQMGKIYDFLQVFQCFKSIYIN